MPHPATTSRQAGFRTRAAAKTSLSLLPVERRCAGGAPGGFTLIELLMVIAIIGVLMALLAVALVPAIRNARVAEVKADVTNLSNAMESYKAEYGAYPPSTSTQDPPADREKRLERHFRKAFPRYTPTNFTQIRDAIELATRPDPTQPNPPGAEIAQLDSAEAVVFYLGGLPVRRPGVSGNVAFELTGFGADPQNPFVHIDVQSQRTTPQFEFKADRLVDRDNDGWPEYIPPGTATVSEMPPYVYFDSTSFGFFPYYPQPNFPGFVRSPSTFITEWGHCAPYVTSWDESLRTANPTDPFKWKLQWANGSSFQIVAAGADGRYHEPPATVTAPAFEKLPRLYPEGINYTVDDNDNITNFAEGVLGDDKE